MSPAYERLPLNALRVFEAVATRLSFGAAAEALHVTPAAVSQQIKSLEDYLQVPLFRRDGRQVQLTPEGEQLLPAVRRGLDELEAALQSVRQSRHAGSLNVSMLSSFLQKWLTPRLAELRTQHPELDLRIHTSVDPVDFARTDFHAAVRLGAGGYEGLHYEKLMDEWYIAVASPSVLQEHGPLPDSGDLTRYPLLHGSDLHWPEWFAGDAGRLPAQRGAFIDDSVSLLSAAVEGLGYAIIRWTLAAGDLQAGRLALASRRILPHPLGYYFVCPHPYTQLPKLLTLRNWLMEQARRFPPPPGLQRTPPREAAGPEGSR